MAPKQARRPAQGQRRHYTEADKAHGLAALAANGGNLTRTSRETGFPVNTIKGWAKDPERAAPAEVRTQKESELLGLIDAALVAVLGKIPDAEGNVQQYATAAGILADKKHRLEHPEASGGGGDPDSTVRIEVAPVSWPDYDASGKIVPLHRTA